jgi:rhodanese-related sulfurtransferase
MATPDIVTVAQLARLIGTPDAPVVVDVRIDTDHASDPRMLPASIRRDYRTVSSWADEYAGRFVVVVCQRGQKLAQGTAAWLRHAGARAENLEGGFEAWVKSDGLLVRPDHVPARDNQGRTVWVTRARPKIDRVACPWLIRRFLSIRLPSSCSYLRPRWWMSPTGLGQRPSTLRVTSSGVTAASSAPLM